MSHNVLLDLPSSQPTLTQGSSKKKPKQKADGKAGASAKKGKPRAKGKEKKEGKAGKGTKRKQPGSDKQPAGNGNAEKKGKPNPDKDINELDDSAALADIGSSSSSSSGDLGSNVSANAHHKHLDVDKLTELKFISQLYSQSQAAEKQRAKLAKNQKDSKDGKDSKDSKDAKGSNKQADKTDSKQPTSADSFAPVFSVIPSLQFVLHPIKGCDIMLHRFRVSIGLNPSSLLYAA